MFLPAILLLCPVIATQKFEREIPAVSYIWPQADTVELVIIGDVMMHSRQLDYDYRGFLDGIVPILREADICAANLEFSLGGEPYSGYPCFSAPDGYAEYLASDCSVDVFLTANNHICDRGRNGLTRTLEIYRSLEERYGTKTCGTMDKPLMLDCKGLRLALVNFTYGINGNPSGADEINLMDRQSVERQFIRAREQKADFIIALPHWGDEYQLRHNATQQKWAEWMVGLGADAIVGSHPHVVQDSTHINGVPVIYSTGNAISNMSARNTRLGLAVKLRFAIWGRRRTMLEPELSFIWCTLPGYLVNNYQTVPVKKQASRRSDWLVKTDFDNMIGTLERVKAETGIED